MIPDEDWGQYGTPPWPVFCSPECEAAGEDPDEEIEIRLAIPEGY